MQNRFFHFGSVSVLEKNSDLIQNEFSLVHFQNRGSLRILQLFTVCTYVIVERYCYVE